MSKKRWDSDWVHFSKRARKGVIVLLLIFIAVALSPRLYYNYIYSPPEFNIQVKTLIAEASGQDSLSIEAAKEERYHQPEEAFDPNTYSVEEWMDIGLSEKQAASILKYLNSGAVLRIKSDVKKLYVIDEELYVLLAPKIDLPDSISQSKKRDFHQNNKQNKNNADDFDDQPITALEPISINKATAWELKKIPGIGPYFATEIIKTRDAYGGIISFDQLFDVYLMDEEKLEGIKPFLILDKNEVKKLDINKATEKELRNHPLISYDMAKSIVFFRENHRPYKRIDEVMLSPYIDLKIFKSMEPYLKVE